jgi:hypothetical protein
MRNLRRHADGLPKGRVRVDGLADVHRVCAHLNRQRNLTDHVARMRANHAAAQDLAVAMCFGGVIKQQFGDGIKAAVSNRPARSVPEEQALLDLDALRLGLIFGEAHPRHFGVGVGHAGNHTGFFSSDFFAIGRAARGL